MGRAPRPAFFPRRTFEKRSQRRPATGRQTGRSAPPRNDRPRPYEFPKVTGPILRFMGVLKVSVEVADFRHVRAATARFGALPPSLPFAYQDTPLRLGANPVHTPYLQQNTLKRHYKTSLYRFVTVALLQSLSLAFIRNQTASNRVGHSNRKPSRAYGGMELCGKFGKWED